MSCLLNRREIRKNGDEEGFTLATYNILADCHIPVRSKDMPTENEPKIYRYCLSEDLYKNGHGKKSKRHLLLMEEIRYLSCDVICFQEVDDWYYAEVFKEELISLGYELEFALKEKGTKEGLLTAFRRDMFCSEASVKLSLNKLMYLEAERLKIDTNKTSLKHLERDSVGLVTRLVHLGTGKRLTVCNFHAYYDYNNPDIATLQTCLLARELERYKADLERTSASSSMPIIYCGDFNTEPTHFGYRIVVNGQLTTEEKYRLARTFFHINEETSRSEGKGKQFNEKCAASIFKDSFTHGLKLRSSYQTVMGHEPDLTSNDGVHLGTFDYIFYSDGLVPCSILAPFGLEELAPGGPSKSFPSDHTSIKTKFRFA